MSGAMEQGRRPPQVELQTPCCRGADGWMEVSLYLTSQQPLHASMEMKTSAALEKLSSQGSDSGSDRLPKLVAADSTIPASFPLASPFWWNRVR